jgi:secernin
MWGAEMGFNEHGLACGNEALFTKCDSGVESLTGMDLVRLALERCRTALEAKDLICSLLSQYGQGGNCGFDSRFLYSNGFLLVDRTACYVVETVGREWAWKKVTKG